MAATFAPGIGADATMLGVVDRLLLRPPAHVRDPGQVYELGAAWRWQGMLVSASYFPPLGARPAPGRFFLPDEDALPDGVAVAACLVPSWR